MSASTPSNPAEAGPNELVGLRWRYSQPPRPEQPERSQLTRAQRKVRNADYRKDDGKQARIGRAMNQREIDISRDERVSRRAKAVYCAISRTIYGRYGDARISTRELAKQTSYSVRTVRYALAELEALGLVRITECYGRRGRQTSNLYELARPNDQRMKAQAQRRRNRRIRDTIRKTGNAWRGVSRPSRRSRDESKALQAHSIAAWKRQQEHAKPGVPRSAITARHNARLRTSPSEVPPIAGGPPGLLRTAIPAVHSTVNDHPTRSEIDRASRNSTRANSRSRDPNTAAGGCKVDVPVQTPPKGMPGVTETHPRMSEAGQVRDVIDRAHGAFRAGRDAAAAVFTVAQAGTSADVFRHALDRLGHSAGTGPGFAVLAWLKAPERQDHEIEAMFTKAVSDA